jgi:chitinase
MGRFTFWSLNRDRQCNPPDNGTTSGTCSSVPQAAWDFAKFSVKFAGATPPTNPPTTPPTTPPGGGSCGTLTQWSATAVYTGGNEVAHNGHKWKAQWWTTNEEPGTTGQWGVWVDEGAC